MKFLSCLYLEATYLKFCFKGHMYCLFGVIILSYSNITGPLGSERGITLLVVLASSTSGDHHFCEIVTLFRPPPHQERERLVTASPVMTKSRAPAGGSNYLENGLVKPPRRDTRALSPAGIFGGKAPLRLAAQKSQLHAP